MLPLAQIEVPRIFCGTSPSGSILVWTKSPLKKILLATFFVNDEGLLDRAKLKLKTCTLLKLLTTIKKVFEILNIVDTVFLNTSCREIKFLAAEKLPLFGLLIFILLFQLALFCPSFRIPVQVCLLQIKSLPA